MNFFDELKDTIAKEQKEKADKIRKDQHELLQKFKGVKRNDACPCNSGKKYKQCHYSTIELMKFSLHAR